MHCPALSHPRRAHHGPHPREAARSTKLGSFAWPPPTHLRSGPGGPHPQAQPGRAPLSRGSPPPAIPTSMSVTDPRPGLRRLRSNEQRSGGLRTPTLAERPKGALGATLKEARENRRVSIGTKRGKTLWLWKGRDVLKALRLSAMLGAYTGGNARRATVFGLATPTGRVSSASRSPGETQHLLQGVPVTPTIGAQCKRFCFGHGRRCEAPGPDAWDTPAHCAKEAEVETTPGSP